MRATSGRRSRGDQPTVKDLLYAFRVYWTGIHVLRSGEIEANLSHLAATYALPLVDDLIARKQEGGERSELGPGEAESYGAQLDELDGQLAEAFERSSLPNEVTTHPAVERFRRSRVHGARWWMSAAAAA